MVRSHLYVLAADNVQTQDELRTSKIVGAKV
jgi:hypothetical protein